MLIIKRLKEDGVLKGYLVQDNKGKSEFVDKYKCVELKDVITNADCVDEREGVFRAKAKFSIPTESVNTSELKTALTHPRAKNNKVKLESTVNGSEFVGFCRRLRSAIRSNKVRVETKRHNANAGRNVQYFELI